MSLSRFSLVALAAAAYALAPAACEKKPPADKGKPAAPAEDDHKHDDGHDHAHDDHGHDHAKDIALGNATAGGFQISASVSESIKAGSEAHVTVAVSGGSTKVATVRVWIGTEDAKGSIKGKGEAEEHGFHVHADAPDPLPAGSKLWVEIEDDKNAKHVASFELK